MHFITFWDQKFTLYNKSYCRELGNRRGACCLALEFSVPFYHSHLSFIKFLIYFPIFFKSFVWLTLSFLPKHCTRQWPSSTLASCSWILGTFPSTSSTSMHRTSSSSRPLPSSETMVSHCLLTTSYLSGFFITIPCSLLPVFPIQPRSH